MKKVTVIMMCVYCWATVPAISQTWISDNGNGTFTNPLFYDEFSDPDIIRVGDDFYMAGTTMHAFPGLIVLHSKDLVNWEFSSYCFDKLNMGDEFKLENGKEAYGQGIWAPCIRYNKGSFYIFSNINKHGLQVFISKSPKGPWVRKSIKAEIYDLSVLFDDDGKVYAIHKYDEVKMVELKADFSGVVEGTEKVIIPKGNAMGEGHHIYKIKGKYFIISANYSPSGRMQCARADHPYGPYETVVISTDETMGTERGAVTQNVGLGAKVPAPGFSFRISRPGINELGAVPLHQGGVVDLPNGDWWGFSMMDVLSVGRTTFLSPVTWQEGWPYFGLPGNLGRSPRTWLKPNVGVETVPAATYQRNDDFSGHQLQTVWQWNHESVDSRWKLDSQKGRLLLYTQPAADFLWAKNTLTQRVVGPQSYATAVLDAGSLQQGDYAGLAVLNMPYAAIGVLRKADGYWLRFYDQLADKAIEQRLASPHISLRMSGDYEKDRAQFSYSTDGATFVNVGDTILLPYQLKTFQGSRYALFAYNTEGKMGGFAAFDDFKLTEPFADRSNNIPVGKQITLTNLATGNQAWASPHGMLHTAWAGSKDKDGPGTRFKVHDRGNGAVSLEAMTGGFLTVVGQGLTADVRLLEKESVASLFLWQDMLHHQCMLLSLKTNRYIGLVPVTRTPYAANFPGTRPDRKDGTVFTWQIIETAN